MREIKSVILGFENCEVLEIPYSFIGLMELSNIKTSMSAVKQYGNELTSRQECGTFVMALNRGLNGSKEHYLTSWSMEKPIDRIHSYKDIVSVEIVFTDETKDEFYLNWDETDDGYTNVNQNTQMNKLGDLFIEVRSDSDVYFNEDIIDNKGFTENILQFRNQDIE